MSNRAPLRVGVVGAGWWSTQCHLPALLGCPTAEVVAIVEPDPERLRAAADHYGVMTRMHDIDELVRSGIADAVIIATPHAHHYDPARTALDSGLHVLIEKPMTLAAWQAWELVRVAERKHLHLMVGYTFHFTPHVSFAKDALRSGKLGKLLFISGLYASNVSAFLAGRPEAYRHIWNYPVTAAVPSTYSDPALSGGGQGQLQVSHAMGMVLWLTGQRVTQVNALMINADMDIDVADAINYGLTGGTIGTMGSTGSLLPDQPQQQEFRFYGTEGTMLLDLIAGTAEVNLNNGASTRVAATPDQIYPGQAPARAFVDLIMEQGENHASGEVGASTVEFLECAYRSAAEGKTVRPVQLAHSKAGVRS